MACHIKRLITLVIWIPTTFVVIGLSFFLLNYLHLSQKKIFPLKNFVSEKYQSYQMYNSLPKVLGAFTNVIKAEDAIPELTCQYMKKRKSPMLSKCREFTEIFRSYGIDPLLPLSIAECESNLGEKMPADCYNPFGLGIHSKGTLCFATWEEGFERMAKEMKTKWVNQHEVSPQSVEEIMKTYCPNSLVNSGGSWAKCVNHFLEELQN